MDVHRQEAKLRWFHVVPPPHPQITEDIMGLVSARSLSRLTLQIHGLSPLGGETGSVPRITLSKTEEQPEVSSQGSVDGDALDLHLCPHRHFLALLGGQR